MKSILLFLTVIAACVVHAATGAEPITITNRHGKVFNQIEIIRKQPDSLLFRSASGGGRIMGLDLSEEQQKQFGFDPATLAKATGDVKKKKDDAERAYNEAAARAKTAAAARTQDNATVGPVRFRIAQGSRLISGKVSQNVRSGLLIVSGDDEWKKFVDIEIAAGRTPKLENYPNDKQPAGSVFVGRCLLEGHPQKESIADGDVITVMGYPAGTHSYTSVEQAARTVKKFSASLETVVDRELKRVP